MFDHFRIILSSFGVCLNKSEEQPFFSNEPRGRRVERKYLYFVGRGNNKNLIVSIFKKRWWWSETEDASAANFVWTQLKVESILQKERSMMYSELQEADAELYIDHNESETEYEAIEEEAKLLNIFHGSHSKRFYTRVSEREERKYLRRMRVPEVLHNHYEANYMLGNKKALFYNMSEYKLFKKQNMFEYIPLTFHVEQVNSKPWKEFESKAKGNRNWLWIVKPGENSNQGRGIFVSDSV
jgi:hypothetical protein